MKTGLVLEGGAMRGMYTAGVLDVMLDEDIHVDGVIGVSAGVLFGVNYLSKGGVQSVIIRGLMEINGIWECIPCLRPEIL